MAAAKEYIKLKPSNCKHCYKCIRSCPVKSIRFSDEQAHIIPEDCLLCGQCFVVCPQNAKEIINDVPAVSAAIAEGPVYASVAPSFVAAFPGSTIASFRSALKKLGFADAQETALGASLVKKRYEQIVAARQRSVTISSCCPVVNSLLRKYYPEVLPCLAEVMTPMEAHSHMLKNEHPGCKVCFIGPCIAKKREADDGDFADFALSFDELMAWMRESGIELSPQPDELEGGKARFFPIPGGILKSMELDPSFTYMSIDGMDGCLRAIKEIKDGSLNDCFIEMSACEGGCVGGPASGRSRNTPIADNIAVSKYSPSRDFDLSQPSPEELMHIRSATPVREAIIDESQIKKALAMMGKTRPEQELNCGSCGYATCRDKAKAVCLNKAEPSMCLLYLMEKAQSFSDAIINSTPNGIIVLDQDLVIQQINGAALDLMNIPRGQNMKGAQVVSILDPLPFLDAVVNGKNTRSKKVYLAEYDKYADLTVVYDRSYKVAIGILRDITQVERIRAKRDQERSLTRQAADSVINKQMRVAQQIASLLGETVAETKVVLSSINEEEGRE